MQNTKQQKEYDLIKSYILSTFFTTYYKSCMHDIVVNAGVETRQINNATGKESINGTIVSRVFKELEQTGLFVREYYREINQDTGKKSPEYVKLIRLNK